ncbi:adenylate/guanylate cyclase domain-containing protein [Nocardia panacis]|uniref:Adenylate/guanylate cyclase domain-containing protein n=1 Tax=Nocardia panacis TaxID=2340916 RepID=A0A3A4KK58_9NOCA|nr:adenylate/guanylate cyclase domain-containing protein [Nocardia panacis]RJO77044.1 adenylate/guanylate cyclase domain-containing protein [Nocardia panacis]
MSDHDESATAYGSRLLGPVDEDSTVRRLRIQLLLTVPSLIANLLGIAVATALVGFVLPGPPLFTRRLIFLNLVVSPLIIGTIVVIGVVWGTAHALRALRWAKHPDGVPDEAEQIAASRLPRRLVLHEALLWLLGAAVLVPLYGVAEHALIPKLLLGNVFSALFVCTNSYLLMEFALRVITARVLEAAPAQRRRGIGVFGRALLVWLLGTGVPLTLLMTVAVWALVQDSVSTERLAVCVLSLGGAMLVFGQLLTMQVVSATVAPIRGVRQALRRVEDGDLDVAVTVYDGTELGELQSGFNHMVDGLRERERLRELFGRHVGHEVAAAALAGDPTPGGVETEAAALFIDIVGSTTMAATRPAREIVAILNRFFGIVVDEVERFGGLLNKFEGDAALAVFGTPTALSDAPGAALACGRAIRDRLDSSAPDFIAAIGVSSGPVVAGNVGARRRYEFTVIGDPVNEAARLCELAKHDDLLLASASTVDAAMPTESARWQLGELVTLRGRILPTRLARPRPHSRPTTVEGPAASG